MSHTEPSQKHFYNVVCELERSPRKAEANITRIHKTILNYAIFVMWLFIT